MKNPVPLFGILALAGCETPCTELNASLVAIYEDCGVEVPSELEDGGKGECGTTPEEADCTLACYDEAGCAGLDGTDEELASAMGPCVYACNEPSD